MMATTGFNIAGEMETVYEDDLAREHILLAEAVNPSGLWRPQVEQTQLQQSKLRIQQSHVVVLICLPFCIQLCVLICVWMCVLICV